MVLKLIFFYLGLAESQWRRITSAADTAAGRQDCLTCADLRALITDANSSMTETPAHQPRPRTYTDPTQHSVETVLSVSMGCQPLPLSSIDRRLARLRLPSPNVSLARSLKNKFPLTVWLPAAPGPDSRPEFTLIIAQDRSCAVVIAWPLVSSPSSKAGDAHLGGIAGSPLAPSKSSSNLPSITTPESTNSTVSTTLGALSPNAATSATKAGPVALLDGVELFFLSRQSGAKVYKSLDSSFVAVSTPASEVAPPIENQMPPSIFTNKSHLHFTEAIIACLSADYVRYVLDRATPGKG